MISISGPDIRWCGNEAGEVRPSEWSVVAADMKDPALTAELSQQEDNEEFRERPLDETQSDLGSTSKWNDLKLTCILFFCFLQNITSKYNIPL